MSVNKLTFDGSTFFSPCTEMSNANTGNRIVISADVTISELDTDGAGLFAWRSGSNVCRIVVNSSGVFGTQYSTFRASTYTITAGVQFNMRLELQGPGHQDLYVDDVLVLECPDYLNPIGPGFMGQDYFGSMWQPNRGLNGTIENWSMSVNELAHRDADSFAGLVAEGGSSGFTGPRGISRRVGT